MKTMLAWGALAAFSLAAFAPATAKLAGARTARCKIISADGRYAGPCAFTPTGKGSFSVTAPGRRRLVEGTKMISVELVGPAQAEVYGLTADGINSRWGAATRSKTDRACWVSQDFSICVT